MTLYPVWLTKPFNLGTIAENVYFEYQLLASDLTASPNIKYTLIAGSPPPGISLNEENGLLHGVPIVPNAVKDVDSYSYVFSVRATDGVGQISDKSFEIIISNIVAPQIIPETRDIGEYIDGSKFYYDLDVVDPNPEAKFKWAIIEGTLPPGIKLTQNGELKGYLYPDPRTNEVPYTTLNKKGSFSGASPYDKTPYSPTVVGISPPDAGIKYYFTVEVTDGNGRDQERYSMTVYSRAAYTADNDDTPLYNSLIHADHIANSSMPLGLQIRADSDSIYSPIITTEELEFTIRSGTDFFTQVEAIDFNGDVIAFEATGLPQWLILDPYTGWMGGHIPDQVEDLRTLTFTVKAVKDKERDMQYQHISDSVTFTLKILGPLEDTVIWTTPENLGTIFNGDVSELAVSATIASGKSITYELDTESTNRLPDGLILLNDGLISGRASYRYTNWDSNETTFDKSNCNFDNTYNFTVKATARNGNLIVSSVKRTFTVKVINRYKKPIENLYVRALPTVAERKKYEAIINNKEYFPDSLIYRLHDPYYGKNHTMKFLFLPGLDPAKITEYATAINNNHYTKRLDFGNIKTAVAVDENMQVKYEVVYIELEDPLVNNTKTLTSNHTIRSSNPYFGETRNYRDAYPNSFKLMQKNVVDNITYYYKGALPDWMTSPQEGREVLGFTNAVVLAYTVPGASKLIAFRLKHNNVTFDELRFITDRYQLDNHLSVSYDSVTDKFKPSYETIVQLPFIQDYVFKGNVNYASELPFELINHKTVNEIRHKGGIDGTKTFRDGETLIFAMQEKYIATSNSSRFSYMRFSMTGYDSDLNRAETEITDVASPFTSSEGWRWVGGTSTFVPGYASAENMRMGIWRIKIDSNDFVTLEYVSAVLPYEYVFVLNGATRKDAVLYHNPTIGEKPSSKVGGDYNYCTALQKAYPSVKFHVSGNGQQDVYSNLVWEGGAPMPSQTELDNIIIMMNTNNTVPTWSVYEGQTNELINQVSTYTSLGDTYTVPQVNDKYIKFPGRNIFIQGQ